MNEKKILQEIQLSVYNLLKNEGTGHDYFHIERVVNNTKKILAHESGDQFYTLLLAYLHDVGDYKLHNGQDKTDEIVRGILSPLIDDKRFITQIIEDIQFIGYKGGMNAKTNKKEVLIVQDADRLDALGAIGIARAFAYGGSKGRLLHDPSYQESKYHTMEEYKTSEAPTIQHFYDKLLKLKDQMNTSTAKNMAEKRHDFMLNFLNQFYKEWDA